MKTLLKSLRFLYLLWGSILIGTLIISNRIQLPAFMGRLTWVPQFLFISRWGRGLLLSISVVMCLSAMIELWELVSQFLASFSRNKGGDY